MAAFKALCKKDGDYFYIAVKTTDVRHAEELFRSYAKQKCLEFVQIVITKQVN